jgi:5'-methylthioadenosine phosphorylase
VAAVAWVTVALVIGLIMGSGFYDVAELEDRAVDRHDTPYGPVRLTTGRWRGQPVAFVPRHGADHTIAPHAINYRANIWALATAGVSAILATAVSGGISPAMAPGRLVLISDFLDRTTGRADTFFDGITDPGFEYGHGTEHGEDHGEKHVTHTDMTNAYDPAMRATIMRAAELESIELVDGAVYCTANGPRFETPAEIRMMGLMGADLVGMTGYPEVALAREARVPYASIGVVSNWAAGLGPQELTVAEILHVIEGCADPLYRLLGRTIELAGPGIAP